MQYFLDICSIPLASGDTAPHQVNQKVLYNAGLLHILFDIIERDGQFDEVLILVFKTMRALSRGYPEVQRAVFEHIDILLKCVGATSGWEDEMAAAVAEVRYSRTTRVNPTQLFTNNHHLCLEVKASVVSSIM